MKKKLKYLFFLWPIWIIFNAGCVKNETCISSNNNLSVSFYKAEPDSTYSEITVDSLTVYYEGYEDSLIYSNNTAVNSMLLPLSDTAKLLTVVMHINDETDKMRIFYKPFFVFRSTECGVINRYRIDAVQSTGNRIDSIWRVNNEVNESEEVNLYMFVDLD